VGYVAVVCVVFVLLPKYRVGNKGRGLLYVWEKTEVHTEFWWGNLKEDHLEGLRVDGSVILKWFLKDVGCDSSVGIATH
jgi:hypothetical protein